MAVITEKIRLSTKGDNDIIDITPLIEEKLSGIKINSGIVNVSVCGSTGGLTTCEFESGLVKDLDEFYNKLIPRGNYHHDKAWGDGNGHSHLRSSLLGTSLTVPFSDKELILGTWQQIIFIDFDNRSRQREIILQFLGEQIQKKI